VIIIIINNIINIRWKIHIIYYSILIVC